MTAARHLAIMAREPRLGVGKRRLARELGDLAAVRFQRLATARLVRRLGSDPRWRTHLVVTPGRAAYRRALPKARGVEIRPQGRGDLGERLTRVVRTLPRGPVVVIGTDQPDVRPEHVARAFAALGRADAVLGPAADGGYWLVGLARRPAVRAPFTGIRWGGPHALADTLAAFRAAGLSVALLETLADVDTAADVRPHHWR